MNKIDSLVKSIADLIDTAGEYSYWSPQTRERWQNEVLRRVRQELTNRESDK